MAARERPVTSGARTDAGFGSVGKRQSITPRGSHLFLLMPHNVAPTPPHKRSWKLARTKPGVVELPVTLFW